MRKSTLLLALAAPGMARGIWDGTGMQTAIDSDEGLG